MFTPHHVSYVRCHMSRVRCHVSGDRCHVSRVTCHRSKIYIYIFFFGQSGEASRWRVCYKRGLPRLVFLTVLTIGTSMFTWNVKNMYVHETRNKNKEKTSGHQLRWAGNTSLSSVGWCTVALGWKNGCCVYPFCRMGGINSCWASQCSAVVQVLW